MNFVSDNTAGVAPRVMQALIEASNGSDTAYGRDSWTKRVEARFCELFEREVAVLLVATGTAANSLALASLVRPWGAVITHEESHVAVDECGAPEFFSDGAKLIGLRGEGNKLSPGSVTEVLSRFPAGAASQVQPAALSITQATECGLVYTPAEVAALKAAIAPRGLKLHMDGARFANAVAALGCSPADITWKAGVDVLSFGGTKNGAFAVEAVVFFEPAGAAECAWRRKRAGHTISKGRLLGAQFEALLADGHWLDLARHANAMAANLARGVTALGFTLAWPVQANEIFVRLRAPTVARLKAAGVVPIEWYDRALPADALLREDEVVARFVTSFATKSEEVEALLGLFAES